MGLIRIIWMSCILNLPLVVFGQEKVQLLLSHEKPLPIKVNYTAYQEDLNACRRELANIQSFFIENGYLAFSVDSITESSQKVTGHLHVGNQYKWAKIRSGNLDEGTLSYLRFKEKNYLNQPIKPQQLTTLYQKLLTYMENNGYPFAAIQLDSIEIEANTVSASIMLVKNNYLELDSIIIKGDAKTSDSYFKSYLNLKPGSPYNERSIQRVSSRLNQLPFIREIKPPEVVFTPKNASLYLYLESKKASTFDGILGLQPNEETGEVNLTGTINLSLQNALQRGELIFFNWRSLQTNTQDLEMRFSYPYLFGTPIGIDTRFKLYRRDTSFIEIDQSLGLQYFLNGRDYFKGFIKQYESNLLSIDGVTQQQFADVKINAYGVELRNLKLDFLFNPRRGYDITLSGQVGKKEIRENEDLLELNPNYYQNIDLKSTQYQLNAAISLFLPVGRRSTFLVRYKGDYQFNENIFANELFRFGGIHTLRGFDVESIRGSSVSIMTVEIRYLLDRLSNVHLFFDGAYYERKTLESFISDTPFGLGAGTSFDTKVGIFTINYALGKQFDNPILFRSAKIHFGFTNFF